MDSIPCYSESMFCTAIVQQANMRDGRNDAHSGRRSKRLDIGRNIGGWLLETGQWPAFNKDGCPQDHKPEHARLSYHTLAHVLDSQISS